MKKYRAVFCCLTIVALSLSQPLPAGAAEPLNYTVSWLGNTFSGASNRWVQNFFIHTKVQPDGARAGA